MTLGAMRNVPQLNTINPAYMPDSIKWYVGLPLLSGINAHYRNSSFTPGQLGLGSSDGLDLLGALPYTDTLNRAYGELYVEDLAFGINLGNNFLSLSVAERFFANANYPMQFIEWLGLEQDEADIPLGRTFDLSTLEFSAVHYREVALGFGSRLFDGKLTLAGRAKLLMGQAAVQSDNYNFRVWHRPEDDYNYELTGRLDIMASGFDRFAEGGQPFQPFGASNTGIAFDLGARLKLGKATFFASVSDLGKLNWNKKNSMTSLRDIAVSGEELFERATDNLSIDRNMGAPGFSTELVTKIYGGGQIEIGNSHAFTVLANPRLHLGSTELNGSVAYRLRTSKFLDVIASYNYFQERPNSIGVGATINLLPVQIYIATDKVESLIDRSGQKDFQLAAGVNFIFGQFKDEKIIAKNKMEEDGEEDMGGSHGFFNFGKKKEEVVTVDPDLNDRKKKEPEDKYFTFYGTVIDDESDEPVDAVYVDVYVIGPDERRELIHTSRYPGHTFNVPLFQSELQHEISVGGHGYKRQSLSFRANITRLEHEFRMSDGLWTVKDPEPYVDPGMPQLVSAQDVDPEIPEPAPVVQEPEMEFGGAEETTSQNLASTNEEYTFEIIQRTSLRSEPDSQARVMKRLAVGTNLELLEKTDKYWWKMKLGDQIGYVKQRLLVSVQ
ncbi:hypothetical protein CRP01_28470 [Flavilitoribacter nigricans DSM 23189 = NBRC 102662]|uniref:DUF5723 domain-containing protein n=2 Tax=Flavilitoribacter TaxID=2762562 RepID=A0A2D0N3A4_FLAN2|nr:hypothetical protein CRP01_28470 [Flavilitoribacter nigricans DSM 23189 = NBRC 102662]